MTRCFTAALVIPMLVLAACSQDKTTTQPESPVSAAQTGEREKAKPAYVQGQETEAMWRKAKQTDAFTYANYNDVRVTHADLDLVVSFEDKTLAGTAALDIRYLNRKAKMIILDTNDLEISSVEAFSNGAWVPADYTLGPDDPVKGARLEINLPERASKVRIAYRTSPDAAGLQWLTPEQTAGKVHPFMYSQFQPLLARSMAPLQDTPAVRMTYSARIKTPPELVAVMSASQDPDDVRDGDYRFDMPQPIPSYLLAIAVGDIEFKQIGGNVGVYAESYILDAAAAEFEDTPQMVTVSEALYGPYRWGRYDMIVLPPSFPFGGMENPRLSFLTPTLIAGDKSLTNVVAHELAHSWSGNLVTNATWGDAWLNEGFTSYVENRIMEALYGEDRAVMERSLDLASLKRDIAGAERPELTSLKMPADLGHPDDAFSQVSYAGGMFFLKFLERRFGRDVFDAFVRDYFDHFAFQSITTEDFLVYFEDNLLAEHPGAVTAAEVNEWIYQPGLPASAEEPVSDAFDLVALQQAQWHAGAIAAADIETAEWSTHEWLHFLNTLPDDLSGDQFAALDEAFSLTGARNAEIAFAWYMNAIRGAYEPAIPALEEFLLTVGRGKFIYRLYGALAEHGRREWALEVYERARSGYHPIAQRRVEERLERL